jgi:hypothetical protein
LLTVLKTVNTWAGEEKSSSIGKDTQDSLEKEEDINKELSQNYFRRLETLSNITSLSQTEFFRQVRDARTPPIVHPMLGLLLDCYLNIDFNFMLDQE